jgi:hypothetical protein
MQDPTDDPAVSLDDISAIQRQLYRRWLPAILRVGLKMLALWLAGSVGFYFMAKYLEFEWALAPAHTVAAVSMALITLIPYLMWVVSGLWLDFRISRALDRMASRLRDGQTVRASEVRQ